MAMQSSTVGPTERVRCTILVEATPRELDVELLARIGEELRQWTGDRSLEVVGVAEGGARLAIELSSGAAKVLAELKACGQLTQLGGFDVAAVIVARAAGPDREIAADRAVIAGALGVRDDAGAGGIVSAGIDRGEDRGRDRAARGAQPVAVIAGSRELPEDAGLAAAVRLRHALGFEPVPLPASRLSYEPRSSCQCTRACAAVWVGSKSGAVMRLELTSGTAQQSWLPGDREARSVCHVHEGLAPGGGSVLLIGRDDGCLELAPDRHPAWTHRMPAQRRAQSIGRLHLDTWWAQAERPALTIEDVVDCADDAPAQYAMGVTAIAALPRPGAPGTIDLLVATRYPWLYVIEARGGELRLSRRVSLPGWIDWIFAPRHDGGPITCLSRGGYLVRVSHDGLLRGDPPTLTPLPLLPTAAIWLGGGTPAAGPGAAPGGDDRLLIGTTTGLFLVRADAGEQVAIHAVPVTRAGVLSIGAAAVRDSAGAHDYVTLGLGDGRLRVVTVDLILGRPVDPRRRDTTQSFSLELGAPVLAEQALQPEGCPPEQGYVLAVLRDHSVRLFHVTSEQTQRELVTRQWEAYLRLLETSPGGADDAAFELEVASCGPPAGIDPAAWAYALVDVILPRVSARLAGLAGADRAAAYGRITALACALIAVADRRGLQRLVVSLHALTGGDSRRVQQLSAAIIRAAVLHGDDDATDIDFVESHLRELSLLAGACSDSERPLLVFWMRFVRKYIVRGPVFAAKRVQLLELVEQNYRARKHLDALIYQARLHRRGYDLRWETTLDDTVFAVHLASCTGCAIVVVVTGSGGLVALDRATGDRLGFLEAGRRRTALAPFEHQGEVRTLASAVVDDRGVSRIVISADGAKLGSPGVAVIDLSMDPRDPATVTAARAVYPECEVATRVHAIVPFPGHVDTFIVGLDTHEYPVGRLHHGRTWRLERARRAGAVERLDEEGSQLAPGKVPTRAVAVVETDGSGAHVLVAAGSDDGRVLAFQLAVGVAAAHWRLTEWDRVTDPIRCVVLGRHELDDAAGSRASSGQSLFSCYLGTSAGDALALSIVAARASATGAAQPFGPYFAQALWRETHEAPLLAARLWQTELFRVADEFPDRVLVLVTESGRLCIYHHAGTRSNQVSAQNNYYFRGLRLDRVVLPDRVGAVALADGESDDQADLVAASPDGHIYRLRLAYPRGSGYRRDPERRCAPAPGGQTAARSGEQPALPAESWAILHQLFSASQIDEPFELPDDQRAARKLELCELVRLDDGVLSVYALRERLTYHEPWDRLDAGQIRDRARALLHGLRPDRGEHAERMKVIFKSLCGAFLSRDPDALRGVIAAQPCLPPAEHAAIAAVCELVRDDILAHLTHATRGGARIAIVAMKELLRVPVLRAMACAGADGEAVRDSVGAAVAACLRHDDRLVRTETLRAASVMLRNVGVMVRPCPPEARKRVLDAVFPDGLASLAWLLEPIIDGLLRAAGINARTVLVSGAWYRVSAIAQLFYIFPDRTLTLCDHLLGRGLPVDVLALCVQTMRSDSMRDTRRRIEHWFLMPAVDPDRDRDRFIDQYQAQHQPQPAAQGEPPAPPPLAGPWHDIDDATMGERLAHLLAQLALMWGVRDPQQLRTLGGRLRLPPSVVAEGEPSLASLERVVAQLAAIARDLAEAGGEDAALHRLRELRRPDGATRARMTRPIQTIASAIAEHWTDLCEPRAPEPGMKIGRFVLGACLGEGGLGRVFEIADPTEDRDVRVIKVLKRFTQAAREQFVQGARFNERLSFHPHIAQIVEIVEPGSWRLACVMRRYHHDLEHYLSGDRRAHTSEWAADAARHIGEALRTAHGAGYCHGDVKPSNILVDHDRRIGRAQFFLADFDLAHASDDSGYVSPRVVPLWLSQKSGGDRERGRRWLDLAALCLIGYRMLTGEPVDSEARTAAPCVDRLARLASDDRLGPAGARLIATLRSVFERSEATGIDQFLRWLKDGPPAPEPADDPLPGPPDGYRRPDSTPVSLPVADVRRDRIRATRILFLAANPLGTGHLDQLEREVKAVGDRFSGRVDVELTKDTAVRIEDLVTLLRRSSPDILHFSGHGSPLGIVLHDDSGQRQDVTGDALARCLDGRGVSLVVLSSCYSKHQADAIRPVVDTVVGTTDLVDDEAARRFTLMLYQQIFAGSTIAAAFRDARDTVGLHGLPDVFHADGELERVFVPRRGS